MYVGRFLVVAPNWAAYRVSSRSFPNRRVVERDRLLTVAPTPDAPETDNPYVSYNCLRIVSDGAGVGADDHGDWTVVGNGTQVDPVAEKLELGYPPRDALVEVLLALDYEKDDYDTPRIAGIVGSTGESYVGIVRRGALLVHAVEEATLVATYEKDRPEPVDIEAMEADALAREVYGFDFEHPVCAAAVLRTDDGFETGYYNGGD